MGGRSGKVKSHAVSDDLKLSKVGFMVILAGIRFHSFGPLTANDASYKD